MESRWRLFAVLVLLGAVLIPVAGAGAAEPDRPALSERATKGDLRLEYPELSNVSLDLVEARYLDDSGLEIADVMESTPTIEYVAGQPKVEVGFHKLSGSARAAVEAAGFVSLSVHPVHRLMVGYADLAALDEIAAIPEVAVIRPVYGYVTATGSVDNQADISINADDARSTFGVDGSGVTVGVLSDSFHGGLGGTISGSGCDRSITGMVNQVSGDLPPSVAVLDSGAPGIDEGAAMAELIADLAPGSAISFHSAFNSIADFASGIRELVDCGADVVVDDILWFKEPMFQDGLIAQAAQDVVDAGVPFFSSAGNYGTVGIYDSYRDVNPGSDTLLGDDFHDFGGGNAFAAITVPNGVGVRFVLQWSEPFSMTLGDGAFDDFDLFLFDGPSTAANSIGTGGQLGQGCFEGPGEWDPYELVQWTNNTGSSQTIYLAINHYCGTGDMDFRVVPLRGTSGSITQMTFDSNFGGPQIYGHAAAEGAVAVAATDYREIDSGGSFTGDAAINVEAFSSIGGDIPIYFDRTGQPLPGAPVTRFKPEMTAPDNTNTTFFGGDADGDGFPNFPGTSAAAPHAAAVAALMLEVNPQLTPAEVTDLLESTAIDIEGPGTDNLSGAGLIDAFLAVGATPSPDTTKPTWPPGSALATSNLGETSVDLSWNPATDAVLNRSGSPAAVTSYRVYLNGTLDGSTSSTTYTLDGLTGGTSYTASVQAVDGAGNESTDGPSVSFTTVNPLPPGGSFWDDNDSVHEGNIEAIAARGITRGCNPPLSDQYCPDKNVTRGQMAAFLVRALNLTDDGGGNNFVDDDGSTFEVDIAKLAAAGITRGCNPPANDRFCPDKNVTRGQMAAFLVRALNLTDDGGGNNFVDDDGSTFEADIAKLAAAGITLGCNPPTNDRFCPDNAVKRGQMASFLARALNLSPIIPPPPVESFGDGLWTVPGEVSPGTYRNSDSSQFCEWKRLSGFGGDADVITEWLTQEIDIVTIAATDAGFSSEDCGTWSSDLTPRTSSPTAGFGGGTFLVGSEVAPGTWRNSDSSGGCYWERLSSFSGELVDIIDNEFTFDIQTVAVAPTDVGFSSEGCGTWTKIG